MCHCNPLFAFLLNPLPQCHKKHYFHNFSSITNVGAFLTLFRFVDVIVGIFVVQVNIEYRSEIHSQEWRPCWGWKNMGELNFHQEDGPPRGKMHSNGWGHMPRVQEHLAESIFIVLWMSYSNLLQGVLNVYRKCSFSWHLSLNDVIFCTATAHCETSLRQCHVATNDKTPNNS